jgi:hypothetical protein
MLINFEFFSVQPKRRVMSTGKIDKRGPQFYGNNKKEGPSTNISIHSVAIYQFDGAARGGFCSVIDLQNTSVPTCCGIGDTALIRETGYQLLTYRTQVCLHVAVLLTLL